MVNFVEDSPIMIISGEVSGDMFAARLMRAIKNKNNNTQFIGLGGQKMLAEGLRSLGQDNSLLSSFGLLEAKKFLLKHWLLINKIVPAIKKNNIKQIIFTDHEVFSRIAARKIRKKLKDSVKIYFFLPPRVSMWGESSAEKIAKEFDVLFCYMEEDQKIYSQYTENAFYYGNPLSKQLKTYNENPHFFDKHGLDRTKEYIALMPGSRIQEIDTLFPIFLQSATLLYEHFGIEFLMSVAHQGLHKKIIEFINKSSIAHAIHIIPDSSIEIMNHCKIGIICAGTITLEAVMMKMFPIINYKISNFTFNLLRSTEKLPNSTLVGLPNVFLQKRIFPELLQNAVTADRIYQEVCRVRELSPEAYEYLMQSSFEQLYTALGDTNCYTNIAEYIEKDRGII